MMSKEEMKVLGLLFGAVLSFPLSWMFLKFFGVHEKYSLIFHFLTVCVSALFSHLEKLSFEHKTSKKYQILALLILWGYTIFLAICFYGLEKQGLVKGGIFKFG